MKIAFKILTPVLVLSILLFSCKKPHDRLANASREDKNGWVYVHLEGSPADIGYQHGFLLAAEIDSALQMMNYYLEHETKRSWSFYRDAAERLYWNKIDKEYQEEIAGIAEGLQAKIGKYDKIDIS